MRLRIIFLVTLIFFVSNLLAQVEKRISFNGFGGVTILPLSEKLNNAKQATNIFGKYHPAITGGLGFNYRFNPKYSLSNNLFLFFSSKSHYSISTSGLRTAFNYYPLTDVRKFSPFISAGFNINLVNINRKKYSQTIVTDSNANVIGTGIGVTKIDYNYDNLKLISVPVPGVTLGGGVAFRISDKVNIFLSYSYNYNFAKLSGLIKDNYIYNKSNLAYHSLNAGVTFKLLKPRKQMLASLTKKDWDGDPTVTIRGAIIYKKERKSNQKVVPVELVKDTLLKIIPSDIMGAFEYKNLRPEDCNFMLAKQNRKIAKADIQVIHDNTKVDILEEYPTLEMMDDYDSDNIISRDNNFSVNLREGFQHEVDITVLGGDVIGKIKPISYDTLCRNMLVLLKNMQDKVLAVAEPEDNCSYVFPDVAAGPHKIVFVNKNGYKDVKFAYAFEVNPPIIKRQYNAEEDSLDYDSFKEEELEPSNVSIEEILLSKRYDKTVYITQALISLNNSKGTNDSKLTGNNIVADNIIITDNGNVIDNNKLTDNNKVTDSNKGIDNTKANKDVIVGQIDSSVVSDVHTAKKYAVSEMQPGNNYSPDGEEKFPNGYGVQIGAFSSSANVTKICAKFRKRRNEPVVLQVIIENENSYNIKLYRVIVGDYATIEEATKEMEALKKAGYETVLRKHKHFTKMRGN